jgi:opacity protein-like surface antigen
MGKSNKSGIFLIVMLGAGISIAGAQVNSAKWQIGVNGGVMVYQGDLTPSPLGSYKTLKPTLAVYVSRILNPSFLLRTNIAFATLRGNESLYKTPAYRQQRNLSFTSPLTEISELFVWNMFGNNGNEIGNRFSPYLFAGAAVSFINVNRSNNFNKAFFVNDPQVEIRLNQDLNRTPPKTILALPVGIGVEYYLTPKLSLTAETNFRYTFTDYLDGYSYVANSFKKDFYQSHTIGLVFKFGKKNQLDCPVIKR